MPYMTVVVVHNDFEKLALELRNQAEHQVAETANAIEATMKSTTSPRIARTIRTRRQAGGLRAVIAAGDQARAIHAGFVEYGTVHTPSRPFATPAAEGERSAFMAEMRKLLDRGL